MTRAEDVGVIGAHDTLRTISENLQPLKGISKLREKLTPLMTGLPQSLLDSYRVQGGGDAHVASVFCKNNF